MELLKITLIGLFFGTFGTTLGGILGISFKHTTNKFLGFILELASGLMITIICFNLIPEALENTDMVTTIFGIILGTLTMIWCDSIVKKQYSYKYNSLLKTGIVIGIGLSIHNFPEGLAIGSGFDSSIKLGYSLAIAILLHDIPEGISMAIPMRTGGLSRTKTLIFTILSGVTTGVGAFVGAIIANISSNMIGFCLSFAAGAMLYIVSGELIPESNRLYKGRMNLIGNIIGFVLGVLAFSF